MSFICLKYLRRWGYLPYRMSQLLGLEQGPTTPWLQTSTGPSALGLLGTRPHSRRWAAGQWVRLHLYLKLLPSLSHHPQMGQSCSRKTSSGLPLILHYSELYNYFIIYHNVIIIEIKCTINVMCLNHPETILHIPSHRKIVLQKAGPWFPNGWRLLL